VSQLPRNTTDYALYVFSNVISTLDKGQGAYTIPELAKFVGLKPTRHFRNRVRQMASEGLLVATPVFTPRGGLTAVYSLPETLKQQEFPF